MKLTTALGAAMFSACMTPALGAEFSFAYYDASLELVDLTPDDGVAPSIFFPPGFGFDSALASSPKRALTEGMCTPQTPLIPMCDQTYRKHRSP